MPNYKNGKIYKITSPSTDKIYIGSTVQPLHRRFSDHKSCFNNGIIKSSSNIIMYEDCQIELIQNYPCNTKRELEHREQYYIDLYREIIVNNLNAIGNKKEDSIRFKNSQKFKDWYKENREALNEKKRISHHKNKEKNNEISRKYREEHRDSLNTKQRLKYYYTMSWGGDKRYNNNLLKISPDLFD